MLSNRTHISLARRVQLQIGAVIALTIIGVTLLSYQNSINSMRKQALDALSADVSAHTQIDSDAFIQAQQNTFLLRDEYLLRLTQTAGQDPQAEFEHWFVRYPDGLIRVRPELDNFKRLPSIYIRSQVTLTADIRRQVMVAFNLLREWGAPMTMRYYSAYIDLPGIALIMYSPSVNWGQLSDSKTNNYDYPPVRNSAPDRNPKRLNTWTEVYFDDKASIWMLSTITPADQHGQWIGTVSQDISIEALVKHTTAQQETAGTYSLIIDEKNQLIAHPQLMEKIRTSAGNLQLDKLADPLLQSFAKTAYASANWPSLAESSDGKYYLGIGRIQGPNWFFISVYPKALLEERAFVSARTILIAGLIGLVIELLLLAWIIRRQIGSPLRHLTQQIRQLDYTNIATSWKISHHIKSRKDELGELSKTFDEMVVELINYQNHLEELVAERTEKLRVANSIKSDFLSHMSHEIRTPINGVLGLAELMLSEKHTPETTQRVEMIYNSGNYLLEIVNDILDLSKIEAGKLQLESLPISLNDLVSDVKSVFASHAKHDVVELTTMIADDTPTHVYTDPHRLKQILVNLIGNAYKFTEQGHITVSVTPLSDTTLKFSVSDTGIGISPDKIEHLFHAFTQADESTTRNFGGTGLGLTICKELVELMGGEIGVTSTLSAGSCFYFTLPLSIAKEIPSPKKLLSTAKTHAIKASIKILVAEDNMVNQAVIKGMLNKLGATPDIIENGELVVEYFKTSDVNVDVIFMDCEMPIMDGWDASQALRNKNIRRANGEPILIIGLSAHAIEGASQRALASGMDDYLTKPLSMTALIAKLQQYDLLD
jgi:signal transduction histidine kinase